MSGGWSYEESSRIAGPSGAGGVEEPQALRLAVELHVADHDVHPEVAGERGAGLAERPRGPRELQAVTARHGPGDGVEDRRVIVDEQHADRVAPHAAEPSAWGGCDVRPGR